MKVRMRASAWVVGVVGLSLGCVVSVTDRDDPFGAAGLGGSGAGTGGSGGGAGGSTSGGSGGGGGSQTTDPAAIGTYAYSGPGSFYVADVRDDGTFGISVSESLGAPESYSVSGTYVRESTGFLSLVVTAVSVGTIDPEDAPQTGTTALALEVPGFALLLAPVGGDNDEIIPMLVSGHCPEADFSANWLNTQSLPGRDASDPSRDWWGTFDYLHGNPATARVNTKYNLSDLSLVEQGQDVIEGVTCEDGLMQIMEGGQVSANVWLTTGGAMVETFESDGLRHSTILALNAQAVSLSELAGTYAGLVIPGDGGEPDQPGWDGGAPWSADAGPDAGACCGEGDAGGDAGGGGGDSVFPVRLTLATDGTGIGEQLLDVTTGALDEGTVSINLGSTNDPSDGWVKGSVLSDESQSAPLACAAMTDAGATDKTIVFCIGQSPGDPRDPYSIVMVSQPE